MNRLKRTKQSFWSKVWGRTTEGRIALLIFLGLGVSIALWLITR